MNCEKRLFNIFKLHLIAARILIKIQLSVDKQPRMAKASYTDYKQLNIAILRPTTI